MVEPKTTTTLADDIQEWHVMRGRLPDCMEGSMKLDASPSFKGINIKTHADGWLWRVEFDDGVAVNGFESTFEEAQTKAEEQINANR